MEMQIGERIKEIRTYFNLSQTKFGEPLGLSRDAINNIENLRSPVKDYHIVLICSEYGISQKWLSSGEGQMFNEIPDSFELTGLFAKVSAELMENDNEFRRKLISIVLNLTDDELLYVEKFLNKFI